MDSFPWHNRILVSLLLLVGIGCALTGCQSLPRSGFDPSGERLFESNPFANCPLFNRSSSSPSTTSSTPIVNPFQPSEGASIYTPPPSTLPGDLGASRTNPAVPLYGSTTTTLPPGAHAVTTALIHNPDAGPTPIFADTGGYALPTVPVSGPALIMTPREQIAPLGSEVVLIASYLGSGDRLITNEKIEWSLEGVGTLEKFDAGSHCDLLAFDCVKAKKMTDRYAITKTSRVYQTIDRGTPDTTDDVHLLRGQTWVSVNSMREGTTHVTAFGSNMADWSKRTDVGIVHWVDAQWVLPRLAIAPVGESRALTTTVLRATNGQPRRGWIVRYEILSGPAAGLGTSFAQIEEVETDASGQATAMLFPKEPRQGTNTIGIQIIRPAGVDGDRRVTVGSELVRQTWSGTPNIFLNITGPQEARLGEDLPYVITTENRSSATVQGTIALPIPPLASHIRSEPAGMLQGSTMLWNVDLLPNSTRQINVTVRQGTAGLLRLTPEFHRTGGGGSAVTTTPVYVPSPTAPTPSPPGSGAIRYPGTSPSPTPPSPPLPSPIPDPLLPSQPPATVFSSTRPELSVKMATDPMRPAQLGQPCLFFVRITNTGMTEARNIMALIPLPPELRGQTIGGEPSAEGKLSGWVAGIVESRHLAVLQVPSLPAGKTAEFQMEYPTIDRQGHTITCSLHVDGQPVAEETLRIVP